MAITDPGSSASTIDLPAGISTRGRIIHGDTKFQLKSDIGKLKAEIGESGD